MLPFCNLSTRFFREAYGNVARKSVCNTSAKLQKGFPAWLPLNLYAMKMQLYGKKLKLFRDLNFPPGGALDHSAMPAVAKMVISHVGAEIRFLVHDHCQIIR